MLTQFQSNILCERQEFLVFNFWKNENAQRQNISIFWSKIEVKSGGHCVKSNNEIWRKVFEKISKQIFTNNFYYKTVVYVYSYSYYSFHPYFSISSLHGYQLNWNQNRKISYFREKFPWKLFFFEVEICQYFHVKFLRNEKVKPLHFQVGRTGCRASNTGRV